MEREDDLLGLIDWDNLSANLASIGAPPPDSSSLSSVIGEIESQLMTEDDPVFVDAPANLQLYDDFLAEILVDSPPPPSSVSSPSSEEQQDNDPEAKKRIRQLRNRDAAVRSRERKKTYVKDLEMKSRYLEAECRRLGRLLQCFVAENQALRLSFHKGNAHDVTPTEQESAVLLLESLLLGSLLWFLGIMCLFSLPPASYPAMVVDLLENAGERVQREVSPRGVGSKMLASPMVQSFATSKRCKASRRRIKPSCDFRSVGVRSLSLVLDSGRMV